MVELASKRADLMRACWIPDSRGSIRKTAGFSGGMRDESVSSDETASLDCLFFFSFVCFGGWFDGGDLPGCIRRK